MRDIGELVDVPDPAWPWVTDDLDCSFAHYTVLPPDPAQCRATLHQLQVTARSPLGAIVLNTGGILMHDGWLRIYGGSGGGPAGLPSMAEVNGFPAAVEPGQSALTADPEIPSRIFSHPSHYIWQTLGRVVDVKHIARDLQQVPLCGDPNIAVTRFKQIFRVSGFN